jgi:acyl-CoA dehydrogenase
MSACAAPAFPINETADTICRRAAALFEDDDANPWGFAYAREYDIERKWREARLYQTAPISTNLILGYIGQRVLGC